ncbi:MAG: Cgl0159 family (beta/alpha)8-fold protein, partial [Acidimicrobiales bacterium]
WGKALSLPTVCGVAVGRSLLYPVGGDVAGAVDRVVELVDGHGRAASVVGEV